MIELKQSGLPLYLNEENNVIALSAPLLYDGYGTKNVGQMCGLMANEENLDSDDTFYDVYRGIRFPQDKELLDSNDFRYDITIVMDGLVNGECKKTSGHYHGYNPARTNTYAEVYEVIKGTAIYILQRADNFDIAPTDIVIDDLIVAVVNEGQSIIIPPNYGHCSINAGEGILVFSNLAYVPCPVVYDSVKYYHGMSYYVKKENDKVSVELNKNYQNVPSLKFASVKENQRLGIKFGLPVYTSYKNTPNSFDFLKNPDPYVNEIMSMLDIKKTLEEVL